MGHAEPTDLACVATSARLRVFVRLVISNTTVIPAPIPLGHPQFVYSSVHQVCGGLLSLVLKL
jgi:hypothetical protein